MKRHCTRLLLTVFSVVLCLFVLTGCSTFGAIVKSNVSGLPVWYYDPEVRTGTGYTGMFGEGHAATERQAELLAYSDIIDKLSKASGTTLSQESYRELSVLGTITQFGLTIEDRHTVTQEGQVAVYIHAKLDRKLLDQQTTSETKRRAALTEEIEKLVLDGDEYVKAGKEFMAIRNYMKAMAKGIGEDFIEEEYTFDPLYEVVVELLGSLTMSILNQKPESATCTLSLTRKGKFVSSAVSSAEILASYTAVDTRGYEYSDSFVYLTGEDGLFAFSTINETLSRTGTILFSLNLDSELQALSKAPDQEKVENLRSLISSKSVVFSYSKAYALGSIATAVIEHDKLGYVTGSTVISDYMAELLEKDGAEVAPFHAELDDELDVVYEFNHSGRTEKCLLVIRLGLTDTVKSNTGVCAASAEGLASLYICDPETLIYQSDVIYSSAFGETEEEAILNAFKTLADIAYALVKGVYV